MWMLSRWDMIEELWEWKASSNREISLSRCLQRKIEYYFPKVFECKPSKNHRPDSFLGWRIWLVIFDHMPFIIAHRMRMKRQLPSPKLTVLAACANWVVLTHHLGKGGQTRDIPHPHHFWVSYLHCLASFKLFIMFLPNVPLVRLSNEEIKDHLFSGQEFNMTTEMAQWHLWGAIDHRTIQDQEKPVLWGFSTHCYAG